MQSKTETLGSIIWRADKNYCESHGTCYLELKPAFQREYECWDEKMKTKLIESILKGYAINPIWVAPHRNEDIEDVFDGMHRLTTIRDYMQNKFAEEYDKYDGDHIVPWASGGPTTYDNLQVLHRRCHQQKSLGVIH